MEQRFPGGRAEKTKATHRYPATAALMDKRQNTNVNPEIQEACSMANRKN